MASVGFGLSLDGCEPTSDRQTSGSAFGGNHTLGRGDAYPVTPNLMSHSPMSVHGRRVISRTIPAAPRLRVGALSLSSATANDSLLLNGRLFKGADETTTPREAC